jgi:large subunit ribosomal protein L15
MNLEDVKANGLKYKDRRRVGRGSGSGHGKTAGRGYNGAKSRSGWSIRLGWEGGQMPLFRRLPKRGFNNKNFKKVFTIINVGELNGFEDGGVVDLAAVLAAGLVSKEKSNLFKILGNGELTKKLTVKVDGITGSARQKIENAGGTVEMIPQPTRRPKFVKKGDTEPTPSRRKAAPAKAAAAEASATPEAPAADSAPTTDET